MNTKYTDAEIQDTLERVVPGPGPLPLVNERSMRAAIASLLTYVAYYYVVYTDKGEPEDNYRPIRDALRFTDEYGAEDDAASWLNKWLPLEGHTWTWLGGDFGLYSWGELVV